MEQTIISEPTSKFSPKLMLIVIGLLLVSVLGVSSYAWAKKTVTIDDNGKVMHVVTFKNSVQDVLNQAKINIRPQDKVTPALKTKLNEGLQIKINKAYEVPVKVDGQTIKVWTTGDSVEDILSQAKVTLTSQDKVMPALDTKVNQNTTIQVARVEEKLTTVAYKIPFTTEKRRANNITKGITKVLQKGEEGLGQKVVKVTYENGKEIKRELVDDKVTKKPVQRIVAVGTLGVVSRGGTELRYTKSMVMEVTGYSYTGNRTATGIKPHRGVVAVDTAVIPFGTKLYIDGYGYAVAADRGSAIKGSRLDLFFETEAEAVRWGRRHVKVYILGD